MIRAAAKSHCITLQEQTALFQSAKSGMDPQNPFRAESKLPVRMRQFLDMMALFRKA
jgi:hypothetical protein